MIDISAFGGKNEGEFLAYTVFYPKFRFESKIHNGFVKSLLMEIEMKKNLSVKLLLQEAELFAEAESKYSEPSLFGVTDGKAVGTYLEHKFKIYLAENYNYHLGNAAKGIDFPDLNVDIKVTSVKQPQSSCPFKSARQKIYGLGYSLVIFVYDKSDDQRKKTSKLDILHTIFVDQTKTADFQTTTCIRKILENHGNEDDLVACFEERLLPVDDILACKIAKDIIKSPPEIGYLTISNALQWRLQYQRVIDQAGKISGILRIR